MRRSLLLLMMLVVVGCRRELPNGAEAPTYRLKGIVVSSDAAKGEVSIDGEAIPGLMGAMTMPYKLAQPGIATELHPGDHVIARLRISSSVSLVDQVDVTEQAKPDYKPDKSYNVPQPGQAVPNFKFVNQSGRTVTMDDFRGKVLLVTFIYTRCPLPDYCIRMSRNFAAIQQLLAAEPRLYGKIHLLSISFDPVYDTPKVLRSYGTMYAGERGDAAFSHWDFAVPPAAELDAVDQFFDVGVSAGSNLTLVHSLSTAVIGPDGKVVRWYPSNEWTPAAVMQVVKQAAAPLR